MRCYNPTNLKYPSGLGHNYYISSLRPYSVVIINEYDSFGMESSDLKEAETEKEVVCSEDCVFLKIEKRLLAIIITSFDL
jgi:hypothetical protein